jgi:hypothetical protein
MSEKTVITCDGLSCHNDYEYEGGDFLMGDILSEGWGWDEEHETHYCPTCIKKITPEELKALTLKD